ncbi:hypothetical protein TIFTF001_041138 [Ficus carica]|uniref:Uncharacterized protein n=1 Tax=Ficus carica TaxID=3494 RepID=A0AA88CNB0_FICCA|nr:hypothetical protein TIFTF001_041138 [Ficus carica]
MGVKVMPPKKHSKGSKSASAGYDTIKFVSKAAADRHTKFLDTKVSIPERGFHTSNRHIMDIVVDRGWENFAKQPGSSVPAVVYEFYANAYFPRNGAHLENVNTDEVKSAICAFNTAWKTGRNGIPVKLSSRGLDKYGKAWHQFVCAKLMPSVYNPTLGLYFPSLITDLCKQVVVIWEGHEIWEGPRHPIDDGVIARYKKGDDEAEDEPPQAQRPVSTMSVPQC